MGDHLSVENQLSLFNIVDKHEDCIYEGADKQAPTLLLRTRHFLLHDVEVVFVIFSVALKDRNVLLVTCQDKYFFGAVLNMLLQTKVFKMMVLVWTKVEDTNRTIFLIVAYFNRFQVVIHSMFDHLLNTID